MLVGVLTNERVDIQSRLVMVPVAAMEYGAARVSERAMLALRVVDLDRGRVVSTGVWMGTTRLDRPFVQKRVLEETLARMLLTKERFTR